MQALRACLFDKQLAVVDDPSKNKTAVCGRGAGKTTMDAVYLCLEALQPRSLCVYITLTRKNAKLLLWAELQRLNHLCGLGMVPNASDLMMHCPNGSRIWLGGADNAAQIEKYRGFPFRLVILDECASFGPHISELIKDVIEPRLMDLNGTMLMNGTPGPLCEGAFYEASTDKSLGWSWHGWTVLENPFMPNAAAWLAERRRIGRLTEDDPTYLREWRGLWVPDKNALVYSAYDRVANAWGMLLPPNPTPAELRAALPASPEPWEFGLGVDIGYDPDPAAFLLIGWNRRHPHAIVLDAEKEVGLLPSDHAAKINWYRSRWPLALIVADAAGLGKGIVQEWRQRYKIPVRPARDKHLKREHIQLMNGDFRDKTLLVRDGLEVGHELRSVTWDEKRKAPSDRYPNDLTDALEYIWMEAKHFAHEPLEPQQTQDEKLAEEARRCEQRAIEAMSARLAREKEGFF